MKKGKFIDTTDEVMQVLIRKELTMEEGMKVLSSLISYVANEEGLADFTVSTTNHIIQVSKIEESEDTPDVKH